MHFHANVCGCRPFLEYFGSAYGLDSEWKKRICLRAMCIAPRKCINIFYFCFQVSTVADCIHGEDTISTPEE